MTIDNTDIVELMKTKQEASDYITALGTCHDLLFNSKHNPETVLNDTFPYEKKGKLLSLLEKYHITKTDSHLVQQFLQLLKEEIQKLPVVTLSIAFEPNDHTIASISDFFMLRIKRVVLLEIIVNEKIIGGTIITYKGVYKDYSVKKKLEDRFMGEKTSIVGTKTLH